MAAKQPRTEYQPKLSAKQDAALIRMTEEELAPIARGTMLGFTMWTKPDYEPNWHHEVLCQKLDDFIAGRILRLMIFMPPQNGKSELSSRRMPALILGQNPNIKIVGASYADSLAASMNRDVQRIMQSKEYAFLFPESQLRGEGREVTDAVQNTSMFEIPNKAGSYRSVGIGTGLTGHGADVLIIDDPVKDRKEADSLVFRDRAWEWYTSTASTRLGKDGRVLLLMTRWHEDDLAGRLLKLAKDDPGADQWETLSLPAIKIDHKEPLDPREIGEALWPEKYPLSRLLKTKQNVGTRVWSALFQQTPTSNKGNMIKREWFKFYKAVPTEALLRGELIQSWDLAFENKDTSDYVVGQAWLKFQANKYLIDEVRDLMSFTETLKAIETFSAKHPKAHVKLVENKANGPAVIDTLKDKIAGIIGVEKNDSKVACVAACEPDFEAGNVWVPDPSIAPWVHDYIAELTGFPTAPKDDRVDATTQALLRFRNEHSGDFSKDIVPKSNKTIAGQQNRGTKKW